MKTLHLKEPIYRSEVLIMWDCLEQQAAECFVSSYKKGGYKGEGYSRDLTTTEEPSPPQDSNPPLTDCACSYTPSEGFFFGMWIAPQKTNGLADTISLIAHECDHISTALLSNIGIIHDIGNDEPHAYFLGYLVREIIKGGVLGSLAARLNP